MGNPLPHLYIHTFEILLHALHGSPPLTNFLLLSILLSDSRLTARRALHRLPRRFAPRSDGQKILNTEYGMLNTVFIACRVGTKRLLAVTGCSVSPCPKH